MKKAVLKRTMAFLCVAMMTVSACGNSAIDDAIKEAESVASSQSEESKASEASNAGNSGEGRAARAQ